MLRSGEQDKENKTPAGEKSNQKKELPLVGILVGSRFLLLVSLEKGPPVRLLAWEDKKKWGG